MHALTGEFHFASVPGFSELEFLRVSEVTYKFPRHIHAAHSVGVMLGGRETITLRGRAYRARAGDVLLINADEPHANESHRTSYLVLKIAPEVLDIDRPFAEPVIRDRRLSRAILDLHRGIEIESAFSSLLSLLDVDVDTKPSSEGVNAVREYLHARYARSVKLTDLARIANLSPFHLLRTFQQQFGIAPHQYQMQLRVGRARRLLRSGYAIADIAAQTGFCDQSHLSRHFKRIVGMTPGEYAVHSKIIQDSRRRMI